MDVHRRRKLGAYYTCPTAAQKMAEWVVSRAGLTVLEPSFGSGVFVRAIRETADRKFDGACRIVGAELSTPEYEMVARSQRRGDILYHGNFMKMSVIKVDAILGNPPYVRLRDLSAVDAKAATSVASEMLGEKISESASLWMPFILKAMQFLLPGGRMALVLPSEFLHVKYARPLWSILGKNFSDIDIVRVKERIFPEILQDVVILMCDGFSGGTEFVNFRAYDYLHEYLDSGADEGVLVKIDSVVFGGGAFPMALLHGNDSLKIAERLPLRRVGELCKFSVGYVSGDKEFFHPSAEVISEYRLGRRSLIQTLSSSRSLRGGGLFTSDIAPQMVSTLFYPVNSVGSAEKQYIAQGVKLGVPKRYKCRVRAPWYIVPGVKAPDIVLNSFANIPNPLINDFEFAVSNSLLGGNVVSGIEVGDFCGCWYNSLTLLFCEIYIHSLGGGLMVIIPGEVSRVMVPFVEGISSEVLNSISHHLQSGDVDSAYRIGDELVLMRLLGLSAEEVAEIQNAVSLLRSWRMN